MPQLRIAQIMASGPVAGGVEKHFVDLCKGLAHEHQVWAIADPAHGKDFPGNVEFIPFDFSGSRRNPFNLLRLHKVLKGVCPHVVHAHANKAAQMVANLRLFQDSSRVATVHGFKTSNRVFRHFDSVICVSHAIREQVDLPQSVVILNGIDPPTAPVKETDFFRRECGFYKDRPVVLAAGRLAPVKGYAGLIRAWQGMNADLVIAGEGPERFTLESLIQKLNLRDTVHLAGFRRDVPKLMAHSDLVVISSQREGFPYAMVEALHMEKVIVSTRFAGAEGFLPAAFLVPCEDESALHQVIHHALHTPHESQRAYRHVWQWAKSELTVERMVASTHHVYSHLVTRAA